MTKNGKIVLWCLGTYALWEGVLRGVNAVKVTFDKITFSGIDSWNKLKFNLSILINNPLWIGLTIDEIAGDVYMMQEKIALVKQTYKQTIKPRCLSKVNLAFDAYTQNMGLALLQNIQTGDIETLTINFTGYVKIKGVKIPINRDFTYKDIIQQ